jgi:hypothetical protein
LKKGIVTERCTNPIKPKYKYIGEQELGKHFINDPYADSLRKRDVQKENDDNLAGREKIKSGKASNKSDKSTKKNISGQKGNKELGTEELPLDYKQ